jgi:cyclopropane-fatty-acyl-phospholipid synthase
MSRDGAVGRSLEVLTLLFGARLGRDVAVRLWDGTSIPAPDSHFELRVNAPFALRAAFMPPLSLRPGEAFVESWLDVDGDLEAAIDALELSTDRLSRIDLARMLALLIGLPRPPNALRSARLAGQMHSKARDAAAVSFHYDQPVEFYASLLDARLVYSCGYWDDGVADLDAAQCAKLAYSLDKLRIEPGEELLDIGCGWGALVIAAAQRGIRSFGITLSRRQHEEARRRIAALGLDDLARVELMDYRDLGGLRFDGIASIGMVEHVGRERLDEYFAAAYRALKPGGLFLNHGITAQTRDGKGVKLGNDFIGRYVFPDGDLVPIGTVVRSAESAGFEVRDVENLREHYAKTLRAWVANLREHYAAAIDATDAHTERVWRLYMTGSARNFALGRLGLAQTLLAKPREDGTSRIPATRRDLYCR